MWWPYVEEINLEDRNRCTRTGKEEIFKVIPNPSFKYQNGPLEEENNVLLFKGSENKLLQNWDFTCQYICEFEYFWYPFDTQNCYLMGNMTNQRVKLSYKSVTYSGSGK